MPPHRRKDGTRSGPSEGSQRQRGWATLDGGWLDQAEVGRCFGPKECDMPWEREAGVEVDAWELTCWVKGQGGWYVDGANDEAMIGFWVARRGAAAHT